MTFTITDAQQELLDKLVPLGWKICQFYSDGVIDVARWVVGERVRMFIKPDGTVRPPRTTGTMVISAELHELGIRPLTSADQRQP